MMRQGLTARPQRARKYQEPHASLDGITGDTVSLGSCALAGLVNALPFSGGGAAEVASRFYPISLRRPHPLQRHYAYGTSKTLPRAE